MKTKQFFFLGLLSAFLTGACFGQAAIKCEITGLDIIEHKTPKYEVSYANEKGKKASPKTWLELVVPFKVQVPKSARSEVVEKLSMQYFLYVKTKDKKRQILTVTVPHVYVPAGEEMLSSVFISPTALARLFGKDTTVSKRLVEAAAVEVLYQGTTVSAEATEKKKSRWWRKGIPLVEGYLLHKMQTPFAPLWWDRYAEVESLKR